MTSSRLPTLKQLESENRRLLRSIAGHAKSRSSPIGQAAFDSACNRFLVSRAARTLALAKAKGCRNREIDVQAIFCEIKPIRNWQDALAQVPRKVHWVKTPKRSGGYRQTCSLPMDLKMWNYMTRSILLRTYAPRQHIGHWPKRGRDNQIEQIRACCGAPGIVAIRADVRDAYGSVRCDAIYEFLDLPAELIRGAIDARINSYEYVGGCSIDAVCSSTHSTAGNMEAETAPQGLLQGSPTSDLVFSILLDDLPDQIPENLACFSYSDNVIVLSRSEREAQSVSDNLADYFNRHPAGPFVIRQDIEPLGGCGFDHLGYWFRWDNGVPQDRGRLWVGMNTRNHSRFEKSLEHPEDFEVTGFDYVRRSFSASTPQALDVYAHQAAEAGLARYAARMSSASEAS